ncbi:MAG: protease modulator HflC [Chloroflexota bacterium]|nr:protease modulator HflC [Chloroflexota bacterium]MDE2968949.1 protease modulator HflC [Chloroflexota bacterium]
MKAGFFYGIIAFIAAALIVVSQSFFIVDATEYAVVTQFGEFQQSYTTPGLKTKIPFIQTAIKFDNRLQRFDVPPANFITLDKKNLVIDAYARYRITDPLLFLQNLLDLTEAGPKVGDIVTSELNKEVARDNQTDIISETREQVMERVTLASQQIAATSGEAGRGLGIEIVDVRIKRADFPATIATSVFDRMNAERRRVANQERAEGERTKLEIQSGADRDVAEILANAEREALEIRGAAEGQSIQIFAEALQQDPEFYTFLRSLEAYQKLLNNNDTIVLDSEAALFRFLATARGE